MNTPKPQPPKARSVIKNGVYTTTSGVVTPSIARSLNAATIKNLGRTHKKGKK